MRTTRTGTEELESWRGSRDNCERSAVRSDRDEGAAQGVARTGS